ncbi:MAG: sensor histidine kinase [Eggerthella lenta]
MGEDVAGGVLWYVVRNAPTFLAMFFLMLLAVRGRLRFSLGVTVGMALGIVAAVSLACGIGVAVFAGEEGVWATVPVLAVSLLSLAALTKLPWGKRLFVFFSAATAAAIAILAYDVLLRTVALEWSFGARRVLDAVVCSAGPLVLAPLFACTIRWGVEQVDDPALWRRLAAVPAGFFVAANALYMFAYAVEFLSSGSDALYALAVGVLAFLMVASYLMLFSALRTVMENARLREAAQLEELQHERYRSLRRTLRDTAKARHDFRHQLLVIRSFADEDDVQPARHPVNKGRPSAREPGAYALNFALDAVAAHFAERARACGADVSLAFALPERLPLPEADFCMAMANLLENAVEACERTERGEGGAGGRGSTAQDGARPLFVDAEARIEGNAVLVSVRNSCTPSDARALAAAAPDGVLSSDARAATREGDGIGLASVATLAKRYRGEVQVEIDEYAATIRVLLRTGGAR